MEEIKNCPFCGGRAKLQSCTERVGYDSYARAVDYVYVACVGCCAQTGDFRIKSFSEITEYTVQDFRGNPVLRAKAEDEHAEHCKQVRKEAIKAWNRRG